MKILSTLSLILILNSLSVCGQELPKGHPQHEAMVKLIDQYALARETKDTLLLKGIFASDVDQLVSSGEWRNGIMGSVSGMLRSSESNPGTRKLIVEKVRLVTSTSGIVDARYEIQNTDGSTRKMWSTFVVVNIKNMWKITAIRNMLPTGQP